MEKKIAKTSGWLIAMTLVAIIWLIGLHHLEVFYMTKVGPDQVNDYTNSYYWIDSLNNIKLIGFVIILTIQLLLGIRISKVWKSKQP